MWRQKEISQKLLLKPPSCPPEILAPFLMGKRLTLLPECRECTSACPNKPAKRKMQHEQTPSNERCQNESGRCTARTWLSAAWGGRNDTRGDGGSQPWGGGCSSASHPVPVTKLGVQRSLLAAEHQRWKQGMEKHLSSAPAHLPSVPLRVVLCPFKTHMDACAALAPPGKLCQGPL